MVYRDYSLLMVHRYAGKFSAADQMAVITEYFGLSERGGKNVVGWGSWALPGSSQPSS